MKSSLIGATVTWLKKSIKLIIILAVVGGIVYKVKFAPVAVDSHSITEEKIVESVMGTGALDARVKMIISSRISGRIEAVLVDQGDTVKADQLVLTLEDNLLKQNVELAEAALETVRSTLTKVQRDLEIEKAVLDNAVKTYNRQKTLIATGATSRGTYDKSVEMLQTARARQSRAETAVIEARSRLNEATQQLKLRTEQLEDSQIRAPFAGKIIKRDRDPGNIVVPGTSVLSLIATDVLWVRAWVDEAALAKIKVGQPSDVVFRSEPGMKYPGEVTRIASEVDPETREFIVDVTVKKLPHNWAVGQRAEVFIKTGEKSKALVVPESFLKWKDGSSGVFVLESGRAVWKSAQTGLHGNGMVEILEGVDNADTVVSSSNPKKPLKSNQRVKIK